MAATIRIGTSGWSYPGGRGTWDGVFYPARRPRGFDELAYYAEHFDTVEVNSTFYRPPDPARTRRWVERTPPGFLFSVKLYQKFTHPDMYLARNGVSDWNLSAGDVDEFRRGLDPIAASNRLGALLVQFPPSFHAGEDTRDYVDWLLTALRDYPLAVELRHRTWSDAAADTDARLAAHRAAWVFIDEPKFRDSIRQGTEVSKGTELLSTGLSGNQGDGGVFHRSWGSERPVENTSVPLITSVPFYVRLHGRNAAAWWDHAESEDRYDYLYSRAELAPFAERATRAAASGRKVLMYLNNHFSAKAAANAAVLKHELGQPVPGEYPREMIARYAELAGIVTPSGLPL